MIKSIWEIGEDGSGCGREYVLEEEVWDKVSEYLSEEEDEVLSELLFDGDVFVLEESRCDNWKDVLNEGGKGKVVSLEELIGILKNVIKEEVEWREREGYYLIER